MDKLRVLIASLLFLALTAFKLLFPAQFDSLRQEAGRLGGTDRDYKTAITALGRGLSDPDLGEKLVAVFREYVQEGTEESVS